MLFDTFRQTKTIENGNGMNENCFKSEDLKTLRVCLMRAGENEDF